MTKILDNEFALEDVGMHFLEFCRASVFVFPDYTLDFKISFS
jgi:hypothetical protein